jgi:predicted DNA binding CopG/RHH family protein
MKKILNEWKVFLNEEVVGQTSDPAVVIYKVERGDTETLIINKFGMTVDEYEKLNQEPFKGEGSTVKVLLKGKMPEPDPDPEPEPINPLSYKGRGFLDGDPMNLTERAAGVIYKKFEDEIEGDFSDLMSAANMQKRTMKYFKDNNIVAVAPASQYIEKMKMKATKSEEGVKQISDLLKKYMNLKVVRLLMKNRRVPGSAVSGQQEDQQIYILPAIITQDGQIKIFKPSESGWKTMSLRATVDVVDVTNEPE